MVHKELLWRYFNQTATPEEQEIVLEWLTDPVHREQALEFIQSAWEEENPGMEPAMPFEKIFEEAIRRESAAKVVPLHGKKWYWVAASAVVLMVLAGGIAIGYYAGQPATDNSGDWVLAEAHTGQGQSTQLVLSDGSHVVLNADSRLTFPKNMDVHQVVYLEGEALFDIREDKSPVIIRTKELVTTASGSQVKISAFPKDSTVTISVEKGKAKVSSDTKVYPLLKLRIPGKDSTSLRKADSSMPKTLPLIKLRPAVVVKENESVTINKNNGITSINTRQDEQNGTAITAASLQFRNAGREEIIQELEQRFAITVILNGNDYNWSPYSADFKDATLEEILQHMGETLKIDYIINGNQVYLILRKTR